MSRSNPAELLAALERFAKVLNATDLGRNDLNDSF